MPARSLSILQLADGEGVQWGSHGRNAKLAEDDGEDRERRNARGRVSQSVLDLGGSGGTLLANDSDSESDSLVQTRSQAEKERE